jgi:hypothetical protein
VKKGLSLPHSHLNTQEYVLSNISVVAGTSLSITSTNIGTCISNYISSCQYFIMVHWWYTSVAKEQIEKEYQLSGVLGLLLYDSFLLTCYGRAHWLDGCINPSRNGGGGGSCMRAKKRV